MNTICNGIAVRKSGSVKNICLARRTFAEAIGVFEQWRDTGYEAVPQGYQIIWKNVLAVDRGKPCVFKSGEFQGYFGSLTRLNNGLTGNKGDSDIIPGSNTFEKTTPYTTENIATRIGDWLKQSGFDTPEKFIEFMKSFGARLR